MRTPRGESSREWRELLSLARSSYSICLRSVIILPSLRMDKGFPFSSRMRLNELSIHKVLPFLQRNSNSRKRVKELSAEAFSVLGISMEKNSIVTWKDAAGRSLFKGRCLSSSRVYPSIFSTDGLI